MGLGVVSVFAIVGIFELLEKDRGDLFDHIEELNGFYGCYDYPYTYFDLSQIEREFAATDVQIRGKWYQIITVMQILLNIVYTKLYMILVDEQLKVADGRVDNNQVDVPQPAYPGALPEVLPPEIGTKAWAKLQKTTRRDVAGKTTRVDETGILMVEISH